MKILTARLGYSRQLPRMEHQSYMSDSSKFAGNALCELSLTGVSYRVSLFGFAASRALKEDDALNIGLLDMWAGLEWVQRNIHVFGGDPEKVTVFGESAGAIAIGHLINAYGGEKPVPFHRAILESGASTSAPGTTLLAITRQSTPQR